LKKGERRCILLRTIKRKKAEIWAKVGGGGVKTKRWPEE
jgi:hypothetical protein